MRSRQRPSKRAPPSGSALGSAPQLTESVMSPSHPPAAFRDEHVERVLTRMWAKSSGVRGCNSLYAHGTRSPVCNRLRSSFTLLSVLRCAHCRPACLCQCTRASLPEGYAETPRKHPHPRTSQSAEQPQIGDNRCSEVPTNPRCLYSPLAPTWGPQPWHGYSIAVWFSSGPWSKQTSFALLFRSCGKRENIAHQSSRVEFLYPTLVLPALAPTSRCKGHGTPPPCEDQGSNL